MIETTLTATCDPQTILAMRLSAPEVGTLSIKLTPTGDITLVVARRSAVFRATVALKEDARLESIRLLYSWDMVAGTGRFALEIPGKQTSDWVDADVAVPISARDVTRLSEGDGLGVRHPDLLFAALSDKVETVGPTPGLSSETKVSTAFGLRPLADLQCADQLVSGLDTASQIVLTTVERVVPAFGSFAPIRLRAPHFGLVRDIVVAPDQRILIGGSEVEYNFGSEYVLISARHLVNGIAARWDNAGPLVKYAQCVLPDHVPLVCGGAMFESLFVGRIRRNKEVLQASLLRGVDHTFLPEHTALPYRALTPFEASTLADRRAA